MFGRNIGEDDEFRELTAEIKSFAPDARPLLMIDEEGGRVDRLRHLIPGLPSVQAFAEGAAPVEMSRWSGRVIGMALRYFDIEIDLAPVVDIRGYAPPTGLRRRPVGHSHESVGGTPRRCDPRPHGLRSVHHEGPAGEVRLRRALRQGDRALSHVQLAVLGLRLCLRVQLPLGRGAVLRRALSRGDRPVPLGARP